MTLNPAEDLPGRERGDAVLRFVDSQGEVQYGQDAASLDRAVDALDGGLMIFAGRLSPTQGDGGAKATTRRDSLMVDSGASGNFMSREVAQRLSLPTFRSPTTTRVTVADGTAYRSSERVRARVRLGTHYEQVVEFALLEVPLGVDAI
ncbi:MAG: retropepsin-like aspartic protease, partial [Planctomycetota bacterium]|nr:retropepsin-like aspartic protease [Bacteroidota bacterium]MEC8559635.1 retropepsin-like aspartic protease [Planctomycetota bacterium]